MSLTHCLKAKDETEQTHLEVKVISGQADCFLFCFVLGNQGHAIRSLPTHLLKRNTKQLWNFQQICLLPYLPLLFFFFFPISDDSDGDGCQPEKSSNSSGLKGGEDVRRVLISE